MKVLELKGIESFYAAQAFHKIMLGLKMLPAYFHEGYAEFYERIDQMPSDDQETMIREAAIFVKLSPEEQMDVLFFCSDANGVRFTANNSKNLPPEMIHEMTVSVCLEIAKSHKVRLISDSEKKN